MIGKEVLGQKPIPVALVKSILSKREKEGELHYEQKLALEYAKKFSKVNIEDVPKIVEALMKLEIPRFKERHAIKIVDFMPADEETVKTIFAKETITLKKENVQQILGILSKYR